MLNYSRLGLLVFFTIQASGFKGKHTVYVVTTISALYSDYNRLFVIIPFEASLDCQKHALLSKFAIFKKQLDSPYIFDLRL